MAWSYSGDPASSDKDAVRFWVQDTDSAVPLLSDIPFIGAVLFFLDRRKRRRAA